MKILPVLDLLKGQVVHGVGGQRHNYRPIKSRLTASANPAVVADALHRSFGFTEFYVADLDAIASAEPAWSIYRALQAHGFHLWIDAGVVRPARAVALAEAGVARIIAGLETLPGLHVLAEICQTIGDRTVFSLDLRAGVPVCSWTHADAWAIAEQAIQVGVRTMLLLDLSRVGMQKGTGTEDLCSRLTRNNPDVEVIAGGGVRDVSDLRRLARCGVHAVLMATALHDGSVTPAELAVLER
jgi:phosphoribosylformimino-5-aminoimidazole carboxamide ribotide isomerase